MKRFRKIAISVLTFIFIISSSLFVYYSFFYDENKLSIKEKEWIQSHKANVITFNVPNNINVFGYNGAGVFFDYIDKISDFASINVHKNTISIEELTSTELGFIVTEKTLSNTELIHQDHYVLIGKDETVVSEYSNVLGSKIGLMAPTKAIIQEYYKENFEYEIYDDRKSLIDALTKGDVPYIIVPKLEYLDTVLSDNFKIIYHFSDLVINYYLQYGKDETLNSILSKYYNKWSKDNYEDAYYNYAYELFIQKLGLNQAETDTLTNRVYNYGFVSNTPYHTLNSSKKGGITINYLNDFSKFSGVEFKYEHYKTYNSLIKDFNSQKIDLIFNDYAPDAGFNKIFTNFNNKYYIISPLNKKLTLKNIKELMYDKVSVIAKGNLYNYLNSIQGMQIKAVADEKELLKATRNDEIIAIDAYTYDYLTNNKIKNYSIRFIGYANDNHSFKYVNNGDAFYKLFKAYISSVDQNEIVNGGLLSYRIADNAGDVVATIAKYTLTILLGVAAVVIYIIFKKKDVTIKTKLTKDDKLKFIDILTSLKNRNYLNEQKEAWNLNTIYPQSIIVLDLNKIKYLNDTLGHEYGDAQIKAAANILIKTQLDNTEIMRTDGNEFIIYLVGYSEKQVLNYIKKLVREFKELPHEFGAAFGFSMIIDDLKLIDDAINEALIQMRENKEKLGDSNEE